MTDTAEGMWGLLQPIRGDKRGVAEWEDPLHSGDLDGAGVCYPVSHRVHQPRLQATGPPRLTHCPLDSCFLPDFVTCLLTTAREVQCLVVFTMKSREGIWLDA